MDEAHEAAETHKMDRIAIAIESTIDGSLRANLKAIERACGRIKTWLDVAEKAAWDNDHENIRSTIQTLLQSGDLDRIPVSCVMMKILLDRILEVLPR